MCSLNKLCWYPLTHRGVNTLSSYCFRVTYTQKHTHVLSKPLRLWYIRYRKQRTLLIITLHVSPHTAESKFTSWWKIVKILWFQILCVSQQQLWTCFQRLHSLACISNIPTDKLAAGIVWLVLFSPYEPLCACVLFITAKCAPKVKWITTCVVLSNLADVCVWTDFKNANMLPWCKKDS